MGNLDHWEALEKTDPKFTKNFTRDGGFKGTDINPAYRMKRMTEQFGPCGKGWGWEITARWREEFGNKSCVFVQAKVWWVECFADGPDNRHETGEFIGGTAADRTPDEAYKMAVTDAIGKCFLALGVAADVYLGEFDTKYQPPKEAPQPPPEPQDNGDTFHKASTAYTQWMDKKDPLAYLQSLDKAVVERRAEGLLTDDQVKALEKMSDAAREKAGQVAGTFG